MFNETEKLNICQEVYHAYYHKQLLFTAGRKKSEYYELANS